MMLVIGAIYSFTFAFLLFFYAGMIFERKNPKPRTSARVIRPAVITIVSNTKDR